MGFGLWAFGPCPNLAQSINLCCSTKRHVKKTRQFLRSQTLPLYPSWLPHISGLLVFPPEPVSVAIFCTLDLCTLYYALNTTHKSQSPYVCVSGVSPCPVPAKGRSLHLKPLIVNIYLFILKRSADLDRLGTNTDTNNTCKK